MPPGRERGRRWPDDTVAVVLIALSIWLGWQVIREMAVQRLPPEQAIRLSPGSPSVLGRTAESEFAAHRIENAEHLARQALGNAPFNVRALRVLGLAIAEKGQKTLADDILTLAGNWSLRDDPAHAWLMHYRLSNGDYRSAFAHADTLARRRIDLWPPLFRLFTVAASTDTRAVPVLASFLAANPPWRTYFLDGLYETEEGLNVAANLSIALQSTARPFSDPELSALFVQLLAKGRLEAISAVRDRLKRPDADSSLVNGDFSEVSEPYPFEWRLFTASGSVAEILPDELRGDSALRAQFGSYASAPLAEQLIQLDAGTYKLSGQAWAEVGDPGARLSWQIQCFETGAKVAGSHNTQPSGEAGWKDFSVTFEVPARNCAAQWIRLVPNPGDRRTTVVGWYDRLSIARVG